MKWTSYLPSSPESLSSLEGWLWVIAAIVGIISIFIGLFARGVGQYKALILQTHLASALSQIEAKQIPRQLSEKQKTFIVKKLSDYNGSGITVVTYNGDRDNWDYGNDFVSTFKAAGWNVEDTPMLTIGKAPTGIQLIIKDANNRYPPAIALGNVLMELGIKFSSPVYDLNDPIFDPENNNNIYFTIGNRE
jgi:hypothetical protein